MKKICTYLVAAALTGTVLTVSAAAAPITMTVYQGNAAQMPSGYQIQAGSCQLDLSDLFNNGLNGLLSNCPDLSPPGQLPDFPGGDTLWPEQTPDAPGGENTPPADEGSLSSYESEVVQLVNDARQENGLQPLAASGELSRVARIKSQDMVDQNYFSHTSPTYGTPFQMLTSFGVSYRTAGENIAYGQRTPREVVAAWMNSPGHRANILNASYTQIGVGYVASGNYWTQLFTG